MTPLRKFRAIAMTGRPWLPARVICPVCQTTHTLTAVHDGQDVQVACSCGWRGVVVDRSTT